MSLHSAGTSPSPYQILVSRCQTQSCSRNDRQSKHRRPTSFNTPTSRDGHFWARLARRRYFVLGVVLESSKQKQALSRRTDALPSSWPEPTNHQPGRTHSASKITANVPSRSENVKEGWERNTGARKFMAPGICDGGLISIDTTILQSDLSLIATDRAGMPGNLRKRDQSAANGRGKNSDRVPAAPG